MQPIMLSYVTNGGSFVPGGLCEKRVLKESLSLSSGERQAVFSAVLWPAHQERG